MVSLPNGGSDHGNHYSEILAITTQPKKIVSDYVHLMLIQLGYDIDWSFSSILMTAILSFTQQTALEML